LTHAHTIARPDGGVGANTEGPDVQSAAKTRRNVQYPASLAQQRFWLLDRLEPRNPALNIAVRWRIEGDLPAELIEKALAQIVERHETLRTSFIEIEGEPFQVVQPQVSLRVPSVDLTVLPEPEAFAECDRIARIEATTPFNLAIAPLISVTHVRVRSDIAIVLVTTHHAVCDGWSVGLLAREMGVICAAMQAGRRPDLPTLPITYGDYAAWQREVVAGGGLAPEIAYWSRALSGLEFFELPTDFPHKLMQGSAGAIQSHLLDRDLTHRLAMVARQNGCTLFMLAHAALVTLLHRYTGATDIAVGTQVAGRDQIETENLVGLFVNTLVLRADLTGEPSFNVLLDRVRGVIAEALEHEAMPLEKVIEVLTPKRYPGHNAVFSVNFIYQRSFIENTDYGTFRLVDLPSWSAGAMHDLNFFMVERPEGWRLSCEYNAGLYLQASIERLLRHFVNILSAISADPTLPVAAIPILDASERHHLVVECNDTAAAYPRDLTLPHLFARQAAETPGAIAVVAGAQSLTYRDVRQRSDALARQLIRLGVGPNARVGVFVNRTADLVIAPLAILKAGNAYVPLDPTYPDGRLTQIIEQSGLVAIIAQSAVVPLPLRSVPIVAIGDTSKPPTTAKIPALPSIRPEDTAYVIFTSGSTGQPKGVQIPHGALTNFLCAMRGTPGFTAQDTIVAVTTICFDIATLEIFLPLTLGAKVVIAGEEETRDGHLLLSLLKRAGARVLQATPATWELLIEAGWRGDPQLRMLCGGEALPRHLADRLLDRSPELWNMYGPTETTIWSSARRITRGEGPILIGPPIANTQFYVVDRKGSLVPHGGIGELMIGGDGVAGGYWDMAPLTRERFPADRFRNAPGAKLYRTGDLVRMRQDGEFQYLGRTDQQIKLRGFRIELGEIEAVLLRHGAVRHAIATTGESASGETAILAYVELHGGIATPRAQIVETLRADVTAMLPGYMRPRDIIVLDAIPLLPNGKIDRKALALRGSEERAERIGLQPLSDLETRIAQIWCEILGVESVNASADFFELGGHSLLAARLLARVEAVFGHRISMSALFESPGFTAFANLLRSPRQQNFDFRQVVRMGPRHAERSIFAINNTGIFVTLSQRLNEDLSITALQLFDPSSQRDNLPVTIEETAGQYVRLIREIQPRGPYALLGWCNGGTLAFETARQLEEAGEVVSHVFLIDTWIPGYFKRLGWLRSKLADYSYRWGVIRLDWAKVRSEQKSFRRFVANRAIVHRFNGRRKIAKVVAEPAYAAAQTYDHWLLGYTTAMVKAYEAKPISGRLTIFRSTSEPVSRFLDPKLGWGGMAEDVDVILVPGDHYKVFSEPSVSVMANCIEAAIRSDVDDAAHDAVVFRPAAISASSRLDYCMGDKVGSGGMKNETFF
jgi:amino acid adenylation domain-containing protein